MAALRKKDNADQSEVKKVNASNYDKIDSSSLSGDPNKDWKALTSQIKLTSKAKTKSFFNNLLFFFGMCMFAPAIIASTISNVITIIFGQQIWVYVVLVLGIGFVNLILFFKNIKINKIRKYCFSYLEDLEDKHSSQSDKSICPRCGGYLKTCTKKVYHKVKVGDKVTYRENSSGYREEISREGVYETKSRMKTYYVCTNSECRLAFNDELPEYTELPQNKRQAIAMVTGVHSYCKKEKVYAAKSFGTMTTVYYIIVTLLCAITFSICSLGYSKIQDIKYGFKSKEMSSSEVSSVINNLEVNTEYSLEGHSHPNRILKGILGPFAEEKSSVDGQDRVSNNKYYYIGGNYYYVLDSSTGYEYGSKYPANMKDEFGELEQLKFNLSAGLKNMLNDSKYEIKGYEGRKERIKIVVKDTVSDDKYTFYVQGGKVIYYEDYYSVNYVKYEDVTIKLPEIEFVEDPYYKGQ